MMRQQLTKAQAKALFKNPLYQNQENKKKWIKIKGTEVNPTLIQTCSTSSEKISIQFKDGEWIHWELKPHESKAVREALHNQMHGKLSEADKEISKRFNKSVYPRKLCNTTTQPVQNLPKYMKRRNNFIRSRYKWLHQQMGPTSPEE